jgi:exonuclease VII large subunit
MQVLQRGYAIVSDKNGKILSSIDGVRVGDLVRVKLVDGVLESEVKEINQGDLRQ